MDTRSKLQQRKRAPNQLRNESESESESEDVAEGPQLQRARFLETHAAAFIHIPRGPLADILVYLLAKEMVQVRPHQPARTPAHPHTPQQPPSGR